MNVMAKHFHVVCRQWGDRKFLGSDSGSTTSEMDLWRGNCSVMPLGLQIPICAPAFYSVLKDILFGRSQCHSDLL